MEIGLPASAVRLQKRSLALVFTRPRTRGRGAIDNLACLYWAERPDGWEPPEEGYLYSRWAIPPAWFFFYRASDIAWIDATFDGLARWKEARLSAERDTAATVFADRRSLLSARIESKIRDQEIDRYLEDCFDRPGRYLIMDPQEVVGDEWDAPSFARIFAMIENGQTEGLAELDHEGSCIGGLHDGPDSYLSGVFGRGCAW